MKQIELKGGQFALVDDDDYEQLSKYKWYLNKYGYAFRKEYLGKIDGKYQSNNVYMARMVMNEPKGMLVDHKNGNTLDNRKENLRVCSKTENAMNQRRKHSGKVPFKGVMLTNNKKPYRARITVDKRKILLGDFNTPEEAALAYNVAALKHFGEFACLNQV